MTQAQGADPGTLVPSSEDGYDHSEEGKHEEPLTGETTERQPSWRPGASPAGKGIYSDTQTTGTDADEEPDGPRI